MEQKRREVFNLSRMPLVIRDLEETVIREDGLK
ncbi:Uncharacterised protein [Chlamydia abortus]|nr:Uncharacterised protein [Chlamydia abortus]